MKKSCIFILTVIILLVQQNTKAQYISIYGIHANSVHSLNRPDDGNGFELIFLSKGDSIGDRVNKFRELIQFGGSFYYSGLGCKNVYNVPLLPPQVGLSKATLSNSIFILNSMVRFSIPNQSIFTPYFDALIGYRKTCSNLIIEPYAESYSMTGKTNQSLARIAGFNYGVGGGITTSLGKRIKLDIGITYQEVVQNRNIPDLKSACAGTRSIDFNMRNSPNGFLIVNVGMLFKIDLSHYTFFRNSNFKYWYYERSYDSSPRRYGGGGGHLGR